MDVRSLTRSLGEHAERERWADVGRLARELHDRMHRVPEDRRAGTMVLAAEAALALGEPDTAEGWLARARAQLSAPETRDEKWLRALVLDRSLGLGVTVDAHTALSEALVAQAAELLREATTARGRAGSADLWLSAGLRRAHVLHFTGDDESARALLTELGAAFGVISLADALARCREPDPGTLGVLVDVSGFEVSLPLSFVSWPTFGYLVVATREPATRSPLEGVRLVECLSSVGQPREWLAWLGELASGESDEHAAYWARVFELHRGGDGAYR